MTSFKEDVVSDINHIYLSTKFELKKHIRRKRVLMIVVLAIFIPVILYVIPQLFNVSLLPEFAAEFTSIKLHASLFASSNMRFINFLVIIAGAIFIGDAVSGEFEKKTGLLLFPRPQRHTSIFIGKYVAALIVTFLVVSIYYLITGLEIAQLYGFGVISTELAKSYLVSLIFAASVLSVLYFFSSIVKRTITSTLVGFFMLMMILPAIANVLTMVDIEPWFLVTYPAGLIISVFGIPGHVAGPGGDVAPDFYVGIAVMVTYTIIFLLMSIVIANRRKMEG